MSIALVPARLAYSADGTPYSVQFDDVYHSSAGGPAQARHVFLAGNNLPERWRGRARFTILETGFGLGLNFLCARAAWRDDPARPARLHYVSIEKHPLSANDLAQLHGHYPELAALSAELRAAWPMLLPGVHRLEFDGGRVVLTLVFADIVAALPQLRLAADAIFLDGFAPAKNPDMWSVRALKTIGRLAAAGATLATYTAASSVRDALGAAGFSVEKHPGFAGKRAMLCGRYTRGHGAAPPQVPVRSALVIGAGLAGSAVCERLAARGWEVALIDRNPAPAQEASGNHAGTFHPLVTSDDSFLARLSRASFLHALRHWQTLDGVVWARCGVLQMARHADEDAAQRAALDLHAYPAEYARYLPREAAGRAAGIDVAAGGLWFAQGGWVQPATLAHALLRKAGVRQRFGCEVAALRASAAGWTAFDTGGKAIAEAQTVVLANAGDAERLVALEHAGLRRVRGQLTYLPAARLPLFGAVLLRGGVLLPPVAGIAVAGASYDIGDDDPQPRPDGHAGNLERLARILPGAEAAFEPANLDGRVAFRAVAIDRLPLVGPLPGFAGLFGAFAYASRGIVWCSLMAELLASRMEGEPLPLEARLAQAVDPGRFALREARRNARCTVRA